MSKKEMECPCCSQRLESDWLFCLHCGEVLDAAPPLVVPETADAAFLKKLRVAIDADIVVFRAHSWSDDDVDALIRKADVTQCEMWLQTARLGCAEAQWLASRCYRLGHVFAEDQREANRFCDLAAQQGEPLALYDLACRYEAGHDAEPDPSQAAVLYHRAAGAGIVRAQYRLAECYLRSGGGDWEIREAAKWLRLAAAHGLLAAEDRLAELYIAEGRRSMACAEGFEWVLRAARRDDPDAQRALARCYANGEGIAADRAEALQWYGAAAEGYRRQSSDLAGVVECYRGMAELGEAEAQYLLAECCTDGEGVQQDLRLAVQWFEKAAEQAHSQSRQRLPEAYCELAEHVAGLGNGSDFKEAEIWYRKAAAAGNGKACLCLADHYASGKRVAKDMAEAAAWFRKAAELEEPMGQFRLGLCCAAGDGVTRDERAAAEWIQRAADAGLAPAQFKVALQFLTGAGSHADTPTVDLSRGIHYLQRAAEQGYVRAQSKLGECYTTGQGVTKNWEMAVKWLSKAAKVGDERAEHLLRRYGARR